MMIRLLILFLVVNSFVSTALTFADTVVILVRHCEKSDQSKDPVLSPEGVQRAKNLQESLRSLNVQGVFCSEFKRTRLSVEPVAVSRRLEIQERKAADTQALSEEIMSKFKDQTVLVAGHSNTVPELLRHLGVVTPPAIAEDEYDNLFVVTLHDDHSVSLAQLHYPPFSPESGPNEPGANLSPQN